MFLGKLYLRPCMVAMTILLSKYTILYGKIMQLVVRISMLLYRRRTAKQK